MKKAHDTAITEANAQKRMLEEQPSNARAPSRVEFGPVPIAPEFPSATLPAATAHVPSEKVRATLRNSLGDLAFFAALPDELPESVVPYARLLALRVFGGWSLERIAMNDNRPLLEVQTLWAEAREWLSHNGSDDGDFGRLIQLSDVSDQVLRAIADSPQLLHIVEWRSFERILARVLEQLGYNVELQRGTKDGGIDIIAIKQMTDFGAHRYLVQAKRTRSRIGVEPVRELLFLKQDYGATKACLATTSSFTAGAWKLAEEHRWELELRDFERLTEWLEKLRN